MFSVMRFNNHLAGLPDRQEQVSIFFSFSKLSVVSLQCIISVTAFTFSQFFFLSNEWSQSSLCSQTRRAADAQWVISNTHTHTHKKILGNHNKKADSFIELLQIGRNGAMREALSWLICKEQYKTIFIKLNIDSMRRTVKMYEMRERSKTWFGSTCSTKG